MFATKAGSLRKALWHKNRNKSTDTPPDSATIESPPLRQEVSIEEPVSTQGESLSISVEESPNDTTSSSPSSARVYRQNSYSATSIPEDEALDNTNRSNRPPSRLSIKESLKSRISPFLSSRTRVKSANPVLGPMPSVSLTSPDEVEMKSPLSVSIDCTCDIESAGTSVESPTGQLLTTSQQPSACKLHYSSSERHQRSNSASPRNLYQTHSLIVPLKSFDSVESNEQPSKRNSPGTRYSTHLCLSSVSDHPTVFDFEDLTNLDPRKY